MKEESTYKYCFWVLVASIVVALFTISESAQAVSFSLFKNNPIITADVYPSKEEDENSIAIGESNSNK